VVERVPEEKIVALFQARWQEHAIQKHLYMNNQLDQRAVWPRLQQELCQKTLERAALEVDLYIQAFQCADIDICKLFVTCRS
jgi:hypothetical protein